MVERGPSGEGQGNQSSDGANPIMAAMETLAVTPRGALAVSRVPTCR